MHMVRMQRHLFQNRIKHQYWAFRKISVVRSLKYLHKSNVHKYRWFSRQPFGELKQWKVLHENRSSFPAERIVPWGVGVGGACRYQFSGGALASFLFFLLQSLFFIHNPFFNHNHSRPLGEGSVFFCREPFSTAWLNGQRRKANQTKNSQAKNKPSGPSEFLCAHWISAVKTKWRHQFPYDRYDLFSE